MLSRLIQRNWYHTNYFITLVLAPLALLFCVLVSIRRFLYGRGYFVSHKLNVPVVVIGNISVGGTGKTPLVIAIVNDMIEAGFKPGIICRGYGGSSNQWPLSVDVRSDPINVGDEPVLLSQRCHCPVVAGPNRVEAAKYLLDKNNCDVIISDDGLQHYALRRDVEIAVIDGVRRFGNGWCLPAGPLRERIARLGLVDFVVSNGNALQGEINMSLQNEGIYNIVDPSQILKSDTMSAQAVHAVSGIGNNERFFQILESLGMDIIRHPFPDHHPYQASDLNFNDTNNVIMTEKDAVKCKMFARNNFWFLKVGARLDEAFCQTLIKKLRNNHG